MALAMGSWDRGRLVVLGANVGAMKAAVEVIVQATDKHTKRVVFMAFVISSTEGVYAVR
jgi:hypothetical protein